MNTNIAKTTVLALFTFLYFQQVIAIPRAVTALQQTQDVKYVDGEYVAVAESGNIYFSFNGSSWSTFPQVTGTALRSVECLGPVWIASGDDGTLLIRDPGEFVWSEVESANMTGDLRLTSGGGVILAYSEDGVWRSTNGSDWTLIEGLSVHKGWSDEVQTFPVAWANGQFFVYTSEGEVLLADDGIDWELAPSSMPRFHSLVFFNGNYFVSNLDGIFVSDDLFRWTKDRGYQSTIYDRLVSTPKGLVHLRRYDASLRSSEGVWFYLPDPSLPKMYGNDYGLEYAFAAASDGEELLLFGSHGYTAWVPNDTSGREKWMVLGNAYSGVLNLDEIVKTYGISRVGPIPYDFSQVSYGNGRFVAMPSGPSVFVTGDKKPLVRLVAAGEGNLVADDSETSPMQIEIEVPGNLVFLSSDGFIWEDFALLGLDWKDAGQPMVFGNQVFLLPSKESGIYVSSDGVQWEYSAALGKVIALAYGGGIFVASVETPDGFLAFFYSSNGTSWLPANAPNGGSNGALAWNNDIFLGGNDTSFGLHYSTDGMNWDFLVPGSGLNWPKMRRLTSNDYITEETFREWPVIRDIAVGADRFLINYGGVYYFPYISKNGIDWVWHDPIEVGQYGPGSIETSANDLAGSDYFLQYHRVRQEASEPANIIASFARGVSTGTLEYFDARENYADAAANDDVFVAVGRNGRITASVQDRPGGLYGDPPSGTPEPPSSFAIPQLPPPDASPEDLHKFLPGLIYMNEDWWTEAGFGAIFTEYWPWVYHLNHGWLFVNVNEEPTGTSRYFYDLDLGWIAFDRANPKWLFPFSAGSWYYYYLGSTNPRWFFDSGANDFIAVEGEE